MMKDTIYRQAAIDALKNRWKKTRNYEGIGDDIAEECELYLKQVPSAQSYSLNEWCTDCKEYDQERHCCPRFNKVIRTALQDAQRWIPVSERLPQPNEEDADGFIKAYLVQDGRWMDVARWNGDCWIAWGYGTALTNVIAWMPLPEPYRKDGD